MSFLPTNDIDRIISHNINMRMKHVAKFYAWLEINENTPIETKLLILDNCVLSAILYGCEAWGDISKIEKKIATIEIQMLKRVLCVKKGTSNDIIFYELRRANVISKILDRQYKFFQKLLSLTNEQSVVIDVITICQKCSQINHYRKLHGNNCKVFFNNLDRKIRLDQSPMITYYPHLVNLEKSMIYESFANYFFRKIITRWRLSSQVVRLCNTVY